MTEPKYAVATECLDSTLTETESGRLAELENLIEPNIKSFIAVGEALAEIRESRLYRALYDTFEDYCRARWDMGRNYANKQIASAKVVKNLGTIVPKPANESQVRPLLFLPEPQQVEVWQEVIKIADEVDGKVTARIVSRAVKRLAPEAAAKVKSEGKVIPEAELNYPKSLASAYNQFREEVNKARSEKWKNVSKRAVLFLIDAIRKGLKDDTTIFPIGS